VIVSSEHFSLFVTAMVVGFCVGAAVRDISLLNQNLREPKGRRDQIFGSVIGLLLVAFGLAGVVKYHLGG
jgi:hypothetical protein